MKLSALGEFGLIDLIREAIQSSRDPSAEAHRRILVDIGDDAAAWAGSDLAQLATTDALVENVHFSFEWSTWEDLGHKSLAVNLSDIAAMGGAARYALVSLSCPGDVEADSVMQYYRGMVRLAAEHGVGIVGGNLTSSPVVVSTVFVMGEALPDRMLKRSSALPGDIVAVTGQLGAAAAALSALARGGGTHGVPPRALESLLRPRPRLREAAVLVEEGVSCAIDVSDGLVADLGHVCACSGVSAVVRADGVPAFEGRPADAGEALRLALSGGEDYELLFTCAPERFESIHSRLPCRVTAIGSIGAPRGKPGVVVLDAGGNPMRLAGAGWNHFTP